MVNTRIDFIKSADLDGKQKHSVWLTWLLVIFITTEAVNKAQSSLTSLTFIRFSVSNQSQKKSLALL